MLTFLPSFLPPPHFIHASCIFSLNSKPQETNSVLSSLSTCNPQRGAKGKATEDMPNHSTPLWHAHSMIRETFLDCQGRGQHLVDDNSMMEWPHAKMHSYAAINDQSDSLKMKKESKLNTNYDSRFRFYSCKQTHLSPTQLYLLKIDYLYQVFKKLSVFHLSC